MIDKLYLELRDEFGREKTNIARRELTAKNDRLPSYIELLAVLSLRAGYRKDDRDN